MKRVQARMKEISGQSNNNVTRWIEGMDNVTLYRGHATFESADTVGVNGELLRAPKIFINVGARAFVPDIPGLDQVDYLTSSRMLELDSLPEHLIIIGGSYVGLEFGQMYRRFGAKVTIVERLASLISRDDEDVAQAVREILEAEGVEVRVNASCTAVPGIWALGDCNGKGAFTHTSYNDFEIVAANLFDGDTRRVSDRFVCYGRFIDPPLGRIGMTEKQARESGRRVLVGRRSMKNVGRARERSETAGFIKVLVDADSEETLGAAILGVNGDEAIHNLLAAMYARVPYTVISRAVHIHPTVAELLPTVLQNLEPLQ
jgi:pyruvate/2-oxoglutarate dehydrogenase complex dihydrolipoamide dehydrogenase (E3) component